jgi:hypothetical protein
MQRFNLTRSKWLGTKALQSEIKCRFRHGKVLISWKILASSATKNQLEVKGGLTKTGQILNNTKANNHMFDN